MKYKCCSKCLSYKLRKCFNKNCKLKDGLFYWCRKCQSDGNGRYNHHLKSQVMKHFGHICNWPGCTVTEIAFLTGDHIENNGALHRKEIGIGGGHLYRWLIKNNFPPGFQILCWNHQFLKQLRFNKLNHKLIKRAVSDRKYCNKAKFEAINYYGSKCACCGETNIDLLTIDHICGGGRKHKRKIGCAGNKFYKWLRKNNFPPGYQVLCHNCNNGKNINHGVCPHNAIKTG